MVKVVIVNGRPESGKTTFEKEVEMLAWDKPGEFATHVSTVDFVKRVANRAGWDGTKTQENRKFLSDLKQLLANWNDSPYQDVASTIRSYSHSIASWILFVDSREPTEIERFKKEFGATTVLVRRLGDEAQETSNESDANVFDYEYDFEVKNYGDLAFLRQEAYRFIEFMKERKHYGD